MFRDRLLSHRILQRLCQKDSRSQYEILRVCKLVFAERQINHPLPTHGVQPELKTAGNTLRLVAGHTELSAWWVCVVSVF